METPAVDPPMRERLATRIVMLSAVALVLVLTMIGGTLWLSWQLQGAGAAINDAGSLRMRANAVGIALLAAQRDGGASAASAADEHIAMMNATLDRLRRGDAARPLFLPDDARIRSQFDSVADAWHARLEPQARDTADASRYLEALPSFVAGADTLVRLIEQENARKTAWLRMSQMALAALSCLGTVAIVYLLYLWFVAPVQRLQEGLARIQRCEFDVRLPVESRDEFGNLAEGFNRMAAELQALYGDLAGRVEAKTAELAAQNRELTALYEMTAFLNLPNDVPALCEGFIARLTHQFDASGATVRLISDEDDRLHLVASDGVPPELLDAERCMPVDGCLCGDAATQGAAVVHDARRMSQRPCLTDESAGVAAFGIVSQGEKLGSFSLHFDRKRPIPASEMKLLETLGKHFGTALKNRRLAALERQFAVSEERNLVAQGLHDSIAQSLNFLKMQVHLLDAAARESRMDEIREIVPLLEGGVAESYDDVRELLNNFRSKLGSGKFRYAVESTIERFRSQAGIPVALDYREAGGPPLAADHQLQVIFILQEALSNVRKHAEASHVHVTIVNESEFRLLVEDDGQGYDPDDMRFLDERHVGFHIMRERAERLSARLQLTGSPGRGARVELVLPTHARQAV
ncbi:MULTISPECIES: type IV pili methyl-accepting chemotaxis transducer N-terminal domain-containing protein [unclassified Caballeronia]|uniref:type IV pili methyl-accepting chemotaxis transducer N-terminal domain-containing protein n=1 Tax=unclassified Caballeronia TaxID=2646786 RepID=UPI00285A0DE0|nr:MULTISPECIES: type IV pili methyl-accepting chemotaxis transducer N-terminal domain-containing protein [unclassified Caballeronia]MDR5740840.1 type IV pili methyl-accepting chemotaxis transducer N-terminal domain-containing protein [Caballeronia sp. LZ016]MDR5808639.1 type IV pili methyl-accepting chemotaxis transducer N-terminal domain-containing protein [Caballeronia sp. LZ019]